MYWPQSHKIIGKTDMKFEDIDADGYWMKEYERYAKCHYPEVDDEQMHEMLVEAEGDEEETNRIWGI